MKAKRRFPDEIVAAIRDGKGLAILAGTPTPPLHQNLGCGCGTACVCAVVEPEVAKLVSNVPQGASRSNSDRRPRDNRPRLFEEIRRRWARQVRPRSLPRGDAGERYFCGGRDP